MITIVTTIAITAILSLVLPVLLRPLLERLHAVDIPVERSSHKVPTLRGGGAAVALAAVVGATGGLITLPDPLHRALLAIVLTTALLLASLGFVEDVVGVPASVRLGSQLLVGAAATAEVVAVTSAHWALIPVGAVVVAGLVNATNFMDGINGISSLNGAVIGCAFACLGAFHGHTWLLIGGLAVSTAYAGFFPSNIRGRGLFLGDVGSYLLGASVAAMAVAAIAVNLPVIAIGGVLVPYLADAGFTLVRRTLQGENPLTPHRSHVYQVLASGGLGHLRTAMLTAAFSALCGVVGLAALAAPHESAPTFFGILVILASAYLLLPVVVRRRSTVDRIHPPEGGQA